MFRKAIVVNVTWLEIVKKINESGKINVKDDHSKYQILYKMEFSLPLKTIHKLFPVISLHMASSRMLWQ